MPPITKLEKATNHRNHRKHRKHNKFRKQRKPRKHSKPRKHRNPTKHRNHRNPKKPSDTLPKTKFFRTFLQNKTIANFFKVLLGTLPRNIFHTCLQSETIGIFSLVLLDRLPKPWCFRTFLQNKTIADFSHIFWRPGPMLMSGRSKVQTTDERLGTGP